MMSQMKQELRILSTETVTSLKNALLYNNLKRKFEEKNIIEDNLRTTRDSPA
jgi:hypothetical protein